MANKPKTKESARDRRQRVEEMRRQQQQAERRKTVATIAVALVVALVVIGLAVVPTYLSRRNDPANKGFSSFGVAASAASCDAVTDDPVTGAGEHVGPGTNKPDQKSVKYSTVPPTSGPHFVEPYVGGDGFFDTTDAPQVEQLVHNLEHGYTILWYDTSMKGKDLQTVKDIVKKARAEEKAVGPQQKFFAVPWDESRGAFPAGKKFALSHWGAKQGHRQLCGSLSGEVVKDFIDKYPYSDSPEPRAA